ncbi:hypothetical protein [Streptomyces sp. NPDC002122]|uniref:hypothetical protein n=1 Tax=Streptomyces sp. NPDC002122 TaxID=3154407 RepID=UPI00332AEEC5
MPNSARSRKRSRRSLLLIPALLTALLSPLVPTGTALAATPPPTAPASAAPAPEPSATDPTPAPEPTAPTPDPEPSTTAPTPAPSTTTAPTPEPTADPTAAPCPVLPLAPLGDPGDGIGRVTLEPNGTACFTVTVEKPGPHRLLHSGAGDVTAQLYDGETRLDCFDPATYSNTWCRPARAGTLTLRIANSGTSRASGEFAVVPLAPTAACGTEASTRYDAEPVTGTAVSRLAILCQNFAALPGERITVENKAENGDTASSWITDGTGERICPKFPPAGETGCVLPGQGPYRVLTQVGGQDLAYPVAYTQKIRRLSDPAGCATQSVHDFGSAAVSSPGSACVTFTPTATARHDVHDVADSRGRRLAVYGADGRTVCEPWAGACSLTAGARYTVVTENPIRILDRSSVAGCTTASVGGNTTATFDSAGEVDCLTLPLPEGAHLAALRTYARSAPSPEITVVDATGKDRCHSDGLEAGACELTGPGPYRALVTMNDTAIGSPTMTGTYHLAFHRTDIASDCPVLPAGDFTAGSPRAQVTIGEGGFAQCLSIPAGDHTTGELFQFGPSTWSGSLSVFDATGERVCSMASGGWTSCSLTPKLAHTVLLSGTTWATTRTLSRHDVTTTANGCATTPATAVGSPSAAGTMPATGTFRCLRVTTADARNTLHLDVRDAQRQARLIAFDAKGEGVCDYYASGCAVTGSAAYQVLIRADWTGGPTYRFDALRIGTATGPAPECVKVPNVSYGFGPLTATLSEQKSAICAVLPTAEGDDFDLTFTPAGDLEQSPTPRLYGRSSTENGCRGWHTSEGGEYTCSVSGSSGSRTSSPTTLVIGLPERPAQASTAVRAKAACSNTFCGVDKPGIGTVSPTTGGAGKITVKLTGTALHEKDQVAVLGPDGRWRRSTTVSVAPDRRSLTAALDLTGVRLGAYSLSVFTHNGWEHDKGTFTVVAPLRATAAPRISGTAVVGGKVTASAGSWTPAAESYAYQWRANGAVVAGATASSYVLPSSLQGKQLSVSVTARKAGHPAVTSASASVVVKGVAPKATKAPSLTGTVRVGRTLTLNRGTWTPAPSSYAYQWYANGRVISGATKAWFTLTKAQRGQKITVRVTACRTGHLNGVAWTRATGAVLG